ncbi:DUF6483 family protein [Clostridium cylindrosporum]|uniref:Uncharacterized protein n=1 Tax=Clostridium cylindrosporum DSM 605 TaxID=1121307 RepID=A0A0J8D9K5_CLOCY|nr:DUF6483 family protein [Clostridium cylindrosporum]KMT22507.1 hypothetical protein CLCY_10c00520 [Clostridium cylindrosporum DSM 605]
MYENDYIERIIKSLGRTLVTGVEGSKNVIVEMINESEKTGDLLIPEEGLLELKLRKYVSELEISKAEDMLFEAIELNKSPRYLELALFFYNEINKLDEDTLVKHNFSKQEIINGLEEIKRLYEKE